MKEQNQIKYQIADTIDEGRNNMFATEKSISDVFKKFDVKGAQVAIIMIAVNTVLKNIADQIRTMELEG